MGVSGDVWGSSGTRVRQENARRKIGNKKGTALAVELWKFAHQGGAFTKPPDQLYQVRGYTPVTPGSASGYTTEVNYMT